MSLLKGIFGRGETISNGAGKGPVKLQKLWEMVYGDSANPFPDYDYFALPLTEDHRKTLTVDAIKAIERACDVVYGGWVADERPKVRCPIAAY